MIAGKATRQLSCATPPERLCSLHTMYTVTLPGWGVDGTVIFSRLIMAHHIVGGRFIEPLTAIRTSQNKEHFSFVF